MVIAFVWDSDYPWDIRVSKICSSLVRAGHEVHLICRNGRKESLEEFRDGIHIHRLPFLAGMAGNLNYLINFPAFFNPLWINRLNDVVKKHHVQAIIVRDITLSITAINIGIRFRIPVFLDMAEPYPEMLRAMWKYEKRNFTDILVRNPALAAWVERRTLQKIDHVFVMVEESGRRIRGMGFPSERITVVSNTPDIGRFQKAKPTFPGSMCRMKDKFKLLYIGFVTGSRGLINAIEGMRLAVRKNPEIMLVIAGDGKGRTELEKSVLKHGLGGNVFFEGRFDNAKMPEYVSSCDAGIIPHYSCGLWNNTIPNKLFDYMAAGKPVLSSDVTPVRRILEETGAGVVYKDTSPEDFCEKAVILASSPDRARQMGEMGEKAVKAKYNWDADFSRLISVIEGHGPGS